MAERKLWDIFKNFKDDLSVGLEASEQEEIERKRARQVLMKAKAQEIQVLTKTIEEQRLSQGTLVVEMAKMRVHLKA